MEGEGRGQKEKRRVWKEKGLKKKSREERREERDRVEGKQEEEVGHLKHGDQGGSLVP